MSPAVRAAIEAQATALEAQAATLRALAATADAPAATELLGLTEVRQLFGLGRGAILAAVNRGELAASRGARGAILVARAELDRWLASRPVTPRSRPANDLDSWAAETDSMLSSLAPGNHSHAWT